MQTQGGATAVARFIRFGRFSACCAYATPIGSRVILIGGGGHGRVLLDTLRLVGADVLGVVDPALSGDVSGVPVLGDEDAILAHDASSVSLVNGVGSVRLPEERAAVFTRWSSRGYAFATVVHPSAVVAVWASLAEGAQVMAGVVVQPGASIGRDVILNTRCSVDHDCRIGAHTHIAPGATLSGSVEVGEVCHLGTGVVVIQGVRIGDRCLIGAGTTVTSDVPSGTTLVVRR